MRPALVAVFVACLVSALLLAAGCDGGMSAGAGDGASQGRWSALGLQLQPVPPSALLALGVDCGVMVTRVRGPARRSRLLPGDVILRVNETPVKNPADFERLVGAGGRGAIGLFVRRADRDLYIALQGEGRAAPPDQLFKAGHAPTGRPLRI